MSDDSGILSIAIRGGESYGGNNVDDMRQTIELITPHLEMDFLLTADRNLIAAHDDHDVAPAGYAVCDMESADGFTNKFGKKAPLLSEALNIVAPAGNLFIDLKSTKESWTVCQATLEAAARDICDTRTFSSAILGTYQISEPMADEFANLGIRMAYKFNGQMTEDMCLQFIGDANRRRASYVCIEEWNYFPSVLDKCHSLSIAPILPIWSAFEFARPTIERMAGYGVRAFITPYAHKVRELLGALN